MKIVVLTGAGVSAESGLGTFRDAGGLWSKYPLEEVATPEGFQADPAKVHGFYNARRANALGASPNAAHIALARLAKAPEIDLTLVTQNIDDLHERAGSIGVIHMHGQIMRALCAACGHRWDAPATMDPADPCPACGAPRTRPDVVWFGEILYHMDEIAAALARSDVFVSIGTSGTVYPAAGFVAEAAHHGAETIEINLEPSDGQDLFDRRILGPATQTVPAWVDRLLGVA
ncbi:MAG: NAD-dependent deacylase [Pseudomonadota bacterium]